MKTLLVDGYNVIFGSSLRSMPLERARESLVIFSRLWRPWKILVVFDGRMDVPFPASFPEEIYAREMLADTWILEYIRSHPRTACVVVTADRPLASRARNLGAEILTPRAFLEGPKRLRRKAHRHKNVAGAGERDGFPLLPQERKRLEKDLLQEWLGTSEQGEKSHGPEDSD